MFFTLLKCVKTEKFKPLWNLIIHWNLIFQVSYAERFGVSNTARKYKTNRQYIYHWKNRYDGSWDSLRDRSRRPHSHPNHHTLAEIKLIQDMRRRNPHAGLVGRILGQAHAAGLSTLDPRTLLVPYETRNDCSKASKS